MRIPIVRPRFPSLAIGHLDVEIDEILANGQVTNNGRWIQEFERQLTEYIGVPTLCFNNGQTALITMLMAAGIGPGDEVICPSFTFCGTAHAIAMLGAKPVFADINSDTLTIDPNDIQRRMSTETKAVLGADVYGICCDYKEMCLDYDDIDAPFALFDSAPAFGSLVNGKPTGSFGDAQIFSFHATKPFSTMEGGALCTNSVTLYEKARRIRNFGQAEGYGFEPHCSHVGLNGKMMEVCALIGLEQLMTWGETWEWRRINATIFRRQLGAISGVTLIAEPDDVAPIWTYMPILVDRRDEVIRALNANGIGARTYYEPCHLMTPYANGQLLPVTERVASQVIALPLLPDMTVDEMDYICEALEGAMK